MPTPALPMTPAPVAPDRADRATFAARATESFDHLKNKAIPEFQAEANNVYNNAVEAVEAATAASADATTASAAAAQTAFDRTHTGEDAAATALDRAQTALDRAATSEDRTQTGLDRTAVDAALASLVGGPVDSINGHGGVVVGIAEQAGSDLPLTRQMFKDCGLVFLDKGNSGTTAQVIDYTAGSHQKITTTGACTISTSNWPPAGNLGELLLELVNGAAFPPVFALGTTMNWVKAGGSYSTTFAGSGVTLQSAGTDWLYMWSRDAGATVQIKVVR